MKLSVVISYYKKLNNLKLILKALSYQSCNDFEVILSEDDANEETKLFLQKSASNYKFPILHLFQEKDDGFRKNAMLNRALLLAKADKIAFVDGDCVPHKHFVKSYIRLLKVGYFGTTRSANLGENISKKLLADFSLKHLNFWSLLFSDSNKIKESIYWPYFSLTLKSKGIIGHNWGVIKAHLLDINGFDEDYVKAGVGEDVDVEWRLLQNGVKQKSVKNRAITFHIYHERTYAETGVQFNYKLMNEKKKQNLVQCKNGIEKL